MSTARIFSKKAMLAGEVATVDDCRYLVSWYRETSLINTYLILGEFFFFFKNIFNLIYLSFYEIVFICQILFL